MTAFTRTTALVLFLCASAAFADAGVPCRPRPSEPQQWDAGYQDAGVCDADAGTCHDTDGGPWAPPDVPGCDADAGTASCSCFSGLCSCGDAGYCQQPEPEVPYCDDVDVDGGPAAPPGPDFDFDAGCGGGNPVLVDGGPVTYADAGDDDVSPPAPPYGCSAVGGAPLALLGLLALLKKRR